jgi:ribonuclease E
VDATEGGEASDAEGDSDASDDENDTEAGEDTEPAAKDDGKSEKKPRRTRERRWPDRASIEVTPTGPRAEKGSRLMLVDEVPGESCRIAILEKGRLEELFVERAQSSTAVGNIYKARVVNVESAIQAAFVDYGEGMNGFLHVSDLHPRYFPGGEKTEKVGRKTPRRERPPIQEALKKGQEILVQVLKQGIGTKGPTVTSYLSIPGRLMVMMPGMDRVGVSRKVDDEQRDKMRKILDQLELPEGFGFILRTAGYDRTKAELKRDVSYLRRLWDQLEKRMSKVGAPSELYTEGDLLVRTIRDVVDDSIGSIVVNSETGFERAKTFLDVIAPSS